MLPATNATHLLGEDSTLLKFAHYNGCIISIVWINEEHILGKTNHQQQKPEQTNKTNKNANIISLEYKT